MGDIAIRPGSRDVLVSEINVAFNRFNVQATAKKLGPLATTGDFLDICKKLGFLDTIDGGNFAQYKQDLTIPGVNRVLLTAAFRASLTASPAPIPLQILISSGTHDIVTVTITDSQVSIIVVRADTGPAAVAPAAGRKQAARKAAARKR